MNILEIIALWIGCTAMAIGGAALAVIGLALLIDKALSIILSLTKTAGAWQQVFAELHKRREFKWQRKDRPTPR